MTDSQAGGYLALPQTGSGPGVLVLHAWWGLSGTMKAVCERLAEEGFVAHAPDLYHGRLAAKIEEAEVLSNQLEGEEVKAELRQAVDKLWGRAERRGSGLGVVGFSLGAFYALRLSADEPERVRAVATFYGTGGGDFSRAKADYLGHYAVNDPYEPAAEVDQLEKRLRSAGRPVRFYRYKGVGHWFFEEERAEAYNEGAASLAWARTVDYLMGRLESEGGSLATITQE